MIRDGQVRELFSLLSSGISLYLASLKTGMDEKTARKYWKAGRMPSELSERHDWRTRVDRVFPASVQFRNFVAGGTRTGLLRLARHQS